MIKEEENVFKYINEYSLEELYKLQEQILNDIEYLKQINDQKNVDNEIERLRHVNESIKNKLLMQNGQKLSK